MNRWPEILFLVVGLICCLGCSPTPSETPTLRVFAASSLTEAFTALRNTFKRLHPDIELTMSFGGSQTLALQIEHGASVDVFASADMRHISRLGAQHQVMETYPFAENALVLVLTSKAFESVQRFDELPKLTRIILGTADSPIGQYTDQMLKMARYTIDAAFVDSTLARVVSREKNVRLVRAKLQMGVADAAIVYGSDAHGQTTLHSVEIPKDINQRVRYFAARFTTSREALAWMNFLKSDSAEAVFTQHGFASVTHREN